MNALTEQLTPHERLQAIATDMAVAQSLPLEEVYHRLAAAGIDWIEPKKPGRPRKDLLIGQQVYIEVAFRRGDAQNAIATVVGEQPSTIRRYLKERGLIDETGPTKRAATLEAVKRYIEGEPVLDICKATKIRPPTLYAALRARGVALRMEKRQCEK